MSKRELSTDQIWKELWKIFLEQFLDSEQLVKNIKNESEVFAKAIFRAEELFNKDSTISAQLNKKFIFERLI